VFIGALSDRRKGFDLLFEAWRTLCAGSDWNATSRSSASGAEVETWASRSSGGLAGRLRFLRFRRDIPRVLAACDLLVHPRGTKPTGSACTKRCRVLCRSSSATAPGWRKELTTTSGRSCCPTV
jgi:hypothetical protein